LSGQLSVTDTIATTNLNVFVALGTDGDNTLTAGGANPTGLWGFLGNDGITGGATADFIRGGGGNDTITGAGGIDTILFEASAAANGADSITFTPGSGGDVLAFFTSLATGGLEDNNSASGLTFTGAISAFANNTNDSVDIAGKVVLYNAGANNNAVDTATEIAGILNGTPNNDIRISASSSGVILAGSTASTVLIYYVVNDATTAVTAAEVTLVGTLTLSGGATNNITGFDAANFGFLAL
jgi:hypothetical protein